MYGRRNAQGFTLIEVLVALAIIAVAMAAAVRVAGLMTQSNGLLIGRTSQPRCAIDGHRSLSVAPAYRPIRTFLFQLCLFEAFSSSPGTDR